MHAVREISRHQLQVFCDSVQKKRKNVFLVGQVVELQISTEHWCIELAHNISPTCNAWKILALESDLLLPRTPLAITGCPQQILYAINEVTGGPSNTQDSRLLKSRRYTYGHDLPQSNNMPNLPSTKRMGDIYLRKHFRVPATAQHIRPVLRVFTNRNVFRMPFRPNICAFLHLLYLRDCP